MLRLSASVMGGVSPGVLEHGRDLEAPQGVDLPLGAAVPHGVRAEHDVLGAHVVDAPGRAVGAHGGEGHDHGGHGGCPARRRRWAGGGGWTASGRWARPRPRTCRPRSGTNWVDQRMLGTKWPSLSRSTVGGMAPARFSMSSRACRSQKAGPDAGVVDDEVELGPVRRRLDHVVGVAPVRSVVGPAGLGALWPTGPCGRRC